MLEATVVGFSTDVASVVTVAGVGTTAGDGAAVAVDDAAATDGADCVATVVAKAGVVTGASLPVFDAKTTACGSALTEGFLFILLSRNRIKAVGNTLDERCRHF